jgi:serine/threonine-protein kinase
VTTVDDWLTPDLIRGAVRQSKVSHSNRVLDRHRGLHGWYWISYDFRTSRGKGDVSANPLGPTFTDHPFEELAFQHDGGEIVFTLPNGLNGYLLVDSQKRRISRGPTDIVEDANATSGTSAVVTGISCMACHKHGVVRFEDVVGGAFRGNGAVLRKVEDLFLPVAQMNAQLSEDEERFLTALLKAERPFLPVSTVEQLRNLPDEPIGTTARYYQADLTLPVVAAELGFESPEKLVAAAAGNTRVNVILGGMLNQGGVIKREVWDSTDRGNNAFQKIVSELNLGVPGQ